MARMAGGKLFQMKPFRMTPFNGNFSTPFNTDSTSSPAMFFNGNTPFGILTPMNVQTEPNDARDKQVGSVKNRPERARLRPNKNPPAG